MAAEDHDPSSLLNFYRALSQLRHAHPALESDAYQRVEALTAGRRTVDDAVFAFTRGTGAEQALVLINYSNAPRQVNLKIQPGQALWNDAAVTVKPTRKGGSKITIPAQSFAVYALAGK